MDLKTEIMNFLEANNWFSLENKENAEGVVNCYLEAYNLQLQQAGVNGSFFKCTCLRPQTNCFSGKCSYCNKTIQKDITTDDL